MKETIEVSTEPTNGNNVIQLFLEYLSDSSGSAGIITLGEE